MLCLIILDNYRPLKERKNLKEKILHLLYLKLIDHFYIANNKRTIFQIICGSIFNLNLRCASWRHEFDSGLFEKVHWSVIRRLQRKKKNKKLVEGDEFDKKVREEETLVLVPNCVWMSMSFLILCFLF